MSGWLTDMLVATALLMAAVLLVRRHAARLFGARAAYGLWAIPALRVLTPSLPSDWIGEAGPVFVTPLPHADVLAVSSTSTFNWSPVLLAIWATGALFFLAAQLRDYLVFARALQSRSTAGPRDGRVAISTCSGLASPLALGFVHPKVMLPADFAVRFAPEEQRLALAHELAHHRRGDLFANLAGMIVLAAHWFNPLAHFAWRAFRDDQEAACDASILVTASADERKSYGLALIKAATAPVPMAACGMGAVSAIRGRLGHLARRAPSRWASRTGFALIVFCAPVTAMATASHGLPAFTPGQIGSIALSLGGDLSTQQIQLLAVQMPALAAETENIARTALNSGHGAPHAQIVAPSPTLPTRPANNPLTEKKTLAALTDATLPSPAAPQMLASGCQAMIHRRTVVSVMPDGSLLQRDIVIARCVGGESMGQRIVRLQERGARRRAIVIGLPEAGPFGVETGETL